MWEPQNELEQQRLEKLNALREKGIEPYPARVERTHTAAQAVELYEAAEEAGTDLEANPIPVVVAGRIVAHRSGGKVSFTDIEDGSGKVQLFSRINVLGEEMFEVLNNDLDLFDHVQVKGTMMRTRRGEVSVLAEEMRVLSKALSPLPVVKERETDEGEVERYGGLEDPELRYRQRYADLAVNPWVRDVFITRAKTIQALRGFMADEGFLEVETPILQPIYGGAAARPFTTHHNQLHQDLFLRISFELYLKRLLVGGIDAVYEIGRDFRNEGVSRKHNPEFTQLEFYKAYIDYHGVMDLVERLLVQVVQQVTGETTISYQGQEIDFAPPFQRMTLRDGIKEYAGIDYVEHPDAESLAAVLDERDIEYPKGTTWGRLIDTLLSNYVEPELVQPTFLLDYPRDISPLAKAKPDDPTHVERFELFIAGMETGNAFTELNDPFDQEERFQTRATESGPDDVKVPVDTDYLQAMRYGMPPNGGFGLGVDRFVMLLTDQPNIREVLLYPALRQIEDGE